MSSCCFVLFITGLMVVPVYSFTPYKSSSVGIVLFFYLQNEMY